jgi:hypothetical protein
MRLPLLLKIGIGYAIAAALFSMWACNAPFLQRLDADYGNQQGVLLFLLVIPASIYWIRQHLQYSIEENFGRFRAKYASLRFGFYFLIAFLSLSVPMMPRFAVEFRFTLLAISEWEADMETLQKGTLYFPGIANERGESFNIFHLRNDFANYYYAPSIWDGQQMPIYKNQAEVEAQIADMKANPDLEAIQGVLDLACKYDFEYAAITTPKDVMEAFNEETGRYALDWPWETTLQELRAYQSWQKVAFFGSTQPTILAILSFLFAVFMQILKHLPKNALAGTLLAFPFILFMHGVVSSILFTIGKDSTQYSALGISIFLLVEIAGVVYMSMSKSRKGVMEVLILMACAIIGPGSILFMALLMLKIEGTLAVAIAVPLNIVLYATVFTPLLSQNFLNVRAFPKN